VPFAVAENVRALVSQLAVPMNALVGPPGMNIRAGDRFNVAGQAYEVVAVLPQRQIGTIADARLVQ
jgi:hypothetical protein